MKLIYCTKCDDVVRLTTTTRQCQCGLCAGHYVVDKHNRPSYAECSGPCIPLGIANPDLTEAVKRYPKKPTALRCWSEVGNKDFRRVSKLQGPILKLLRIKRGQ